MPKAVTIPPGYEVTRDGRVFSTRKNGKRIEIRQHLNGSGHGYPSVWLYAGTKASRKHIAVYRLVAAVHLPPRPSRNHFVCHKDGDRNHSHADNLYWGTASENSWDAWRHRRERQQLGLPFAAET